MSVHPYTSKEYKRRTWTPGGKIDVRLVLSYLEIEQRDVMKAMGWSKYQFDMIAGRINAIWPAERRKLAELIGVDPPTVLAVRIHSWDGTRGIRPPTGAFL